MERILLANWKDIAAAMRTALGAHRSVKVQWLAPEQKLLFRRGYDSSLGSLLVTRVMPNGEEIVETLYPEDLGDEVGREGYKRIGELLEIPAALGEGLVLRGIICRGDELEDGVLRGKKVALLFASTSDHCCGRSGLSPHVRVCGGLDAK